MARVGRAERARPGSQRLSQAAGWKPPGAVSGRRAAPGRARRLRGEAVCQVPLSSKLRTHRVRRGAAGAPAASRVRRPRAPSTPRRESPPARGPFSNWESPWRRRLGPPRPWRAVLKIAVQGRRAGTPPPGGGAPTPQRLWGRWRLARVRRGGYGGRARVGPALRVAEPEAGAGPPSGSRRGRGRRLGTTGRCSGRLAGGPAPDSRRANPQLWRGVGARGA